MAIAFRFPLSSRSDSVRKGINTQDTIFAQPLKNRNMIVFINVKKFHYKVRNLVQIFGDRV